MEKEEAVMVGVSTSDIELLTTMSLMLGLVMGVAMLIGTLKGIKIFLITRRKSKFLKRLKNSPTTEVITSDSLGIPVLISEESNKDGIDKKKFTFI